MRSTRYPRPAGGFGAVMEQEHELQSSIGGYRGELHGHLSATIARVLSKQQVALGAIIALLEHRYEMLPPAAQFLALHGRHSPLPPTRRRVPAPEPNSLLRNLIAQHLDLLEDLDSLMARGGSDLQNEIILIEVTRNHEDMAGMLSALLKEDKSLRNRNSIPVIAAPRTDDARWENEGPTISATADSDAARCSAETAA